MGYRADIDGLRAIAVTAVILFHLGVGLPGGFVGVDIFFVVSGYLIASHLYAEAKQGTLSIVEFYERRARRILPALLATIIASSIVAVLVLYPSELVEFAKSGIASSLFLSNIYFHSTSNYFAPAANTIPLLHLWSLGIEEQFYIAFPILILLFAKRGQALLISLLAAMCFASLVASQITAKTNPSAAFYLPQYRAFELLIGCLLALPSVPRLRGQFLPNLVWGIGAVGIGFAVLSFGPETPFPGLAALLPCAGAAMIIWSGQSTPALSRLLTHRPIVYLGKISYSLYLVHWPVLVFGKRIFPYTPTILFATVAALATIVLAIASFKFIEQPFRRRKEGRSTFKALGISAASIAAIALLGGWTIHKSGFEASADQRAATFLSYLQFDPRPLYRGGECFLDPDQGMSSIKLEKCLPNGSGIPAILWGDSHAAHLYPGLQITLENEGYSLGQLTASACGPIVGLEIAARPKCKSFNEEVIRLLISIKPRIVILSANWRTDALPQLDETIRSLVQAGIRVVLLGDSPQFKISVPTIIARRIQDGDVSRVSGNDLKTAYMRDSDRKMSSRFANRDDVHMISIYGTICPNKECPLRANDVTPMMFDTAHLTKEGSLYFAQRLTPLIIRSAPKAKH